MTSAFPSRPVVTAISSKVGRGHPSYLDSVLIALRELGREVPVTAASGLGWSLARVAYRLGAQGGIRSALYDLARSGSRPSRLQLGLLDSGLRRRFRGYPGTVLVDHPLLAHLLAPVCRVAYLHAEIAAPPATAVTGAWRTFVPLEQTRRKLVAAGCRPSAVFVTGLVIEPELLPLAEASFATRLSRLSARGRRLTVGLFTSGAYPKRHMQDITRAMRSLADAGHHGILFCGTSRARAESICTALSPRAGTGVCGPSYLAPWAHPRIPGAPPPPDGDCAVVCCESRHAETSCTARNFAHLDLMVAAAHERTNWAVGLGLPLFTLLPHIGPFAKENFDFASAQGTCLPLQDATRFGTMLNDLHGSGRIAEMSRAGWGIFPVTGAKTTAESLLAAS